MISGLGVDLLLLADDGGFDDRRDLHLQDFRIGHAQAAAAMAQHRVGFVQLRHACLDVSRLDAQIAWPFRPGSWRRAAGTRAAAGRAGER